MRATHWILIGLLAALVTACSGPSLQERGDTNLQRGEYEAAASNYQAALEKDPDNYELQRKFDRAADLAVVANLEEARDYASQGAWNEAIYSTSTAIEWGPRRRDVSVWATGFDQRLSAEVLARMESRDFASAVSLADEAGEYLPSRYHQDTMRARSQAVGEWSQWLIVEARDAESAGAIATSALYLAEAADVTGDPAFGREALEKAERLRGDHRVAYSVHARQTRSAGVLNYVPDFIGSASVVKGQLSDADLAIEVDLRGLRVVDDTFTEILSKDYIAGHESRKNPEWLRLHRKVERITREVDEAKIRESRARRASEADPSDRNKAIYAAARDEVRILEDRKRERERDLRLEDEFVREEVHAVHRWEAQTVKRTGIATLSMRWTDPITGRRQSKTEPIQVVVEDFSQPGYRDAGVKNDPLVLPSIAEMEGKVEAVAADFVVSLLDQSYSAHLASAMEGAAETHGAAEAAALGIVLSTANPPAGTVSKFAGLTGVRRTIAQSLAALDS